MLAPLREIILSCVDKAEGNLSTSAFIPFCAFAGDMTLVGQSVDGFSLPVCNIFHPKEVLSYPFIARKQEVEGQVCFSTNHSTVENLPSPDQGSNKGADYFNKPC